MVIAFWFTIFSVSRDIECWSLARTSEILGAADILSTPIFWGIPKWWAGTNRTGQCGRKSTHISWPASCNQSLGDCRMWKQHLQEESTSEVREKPATPDFVGPKQWKDAPPDLYIIYTCANILSTTIFCCHPNFFWRLTFVDANILLTPIFLLALMFWWCLFIELWKTANRELRVKIYCISTHEQGKQYTEESGLLISRILCTTSLADLLPANSYIKYYYI